MVQDTSGRMNSTSLYQCLLEWVVAALPRRLGSSMELLALVSGEKAHLHLAHGNVLKPTDQLVPAGCLQDILLAIVAGELVAQGDLRPGDHVGLHLPELMEGTAPGAKIRVVDLLNHASGYWPPRGNGDAQLAPWQIVKSFLTTTHPLFPAGSVVTGSLLERIVLAQLLSKRLGYNVYGYIDEALLPRFGAGHFAPLPYAPNSAVQELLVTLETVANIIVTSLNSTTWGMELQRQENSTSAPIIPTGNPKKDFVPLRMQWGVMRYVPPLLGKGGLSTSNFSGVRFDTTGKTLIVGTFPTWFVRDHLLNEICRHLGFTNYSPRTSFVGDLSGFSISALDGIYERWNAEQLRVCTNRETLRLAWSGKKTVGQFTCRALDDGTLVASTLSRIWPSFWLQPFPHPLTGEVCIMVGTSAYRKLSSGVV
jgi:hypothetical protein